MTEIAVLMLVPRCLMPRFYIAVLYRSLILCFDAAVRNRGSTLLLRIRFSPALKSNRQSVV